MYHFRRRVINVRSGNETFVNAEPNMDDPSVILNRLRTKNLNKPIIGQININFLEKMFESLVSLVKDKIDIIMISETKLDDTFPFSRFTIEGYFQQFRLDRICHGGGIIIYVKIDLYSRPGNVEGMFIEITLGITKWLPKRENISYFRIILVRD